jgi:hypothetical protein
MSNMLGLEDPMIIFTSTDMVEAISQLRGHAANRTVILPMELNDLPLVQKYSLEIWQAEYDRDPEKKRHAGYQVFWIWLSKTWFLQEAVKRNPYKSTNFMWSDIGCFRTKRDARYKGQVLMQHPEVIPPDRMLFMAHHEPNPPESVWWTDKLKENEHFYHSGTMMVGSSNVIPKFHQAFLQVVQGFLDRKLFIGDDQTVLQSTCLQHPHFCAYVPASQVKGDNHYFGLRSVLQRGGKYDFWFPPSLPSSGAQNKPETGAILVGGTTLPSAKSLLTKPPPYQDSQIIKLSDTLISSPNTVVTAYFRVRSKFSVDNYSSWMKNILSLQDAMVIFTEPDLVDTMRELRKHALNRTVIIQMELDDLPIGPLYTKEFWEDQLDRDPEKRVHKSPQLFWIWLSKSWWTLEAIRHNFFQSDLFFYSDMGCFRNDKYNGKTMILHRDQVPPHEMIQMAHHEANPPAERFFNDKYKHKSNFYHSGSQMAGYADTWKKFHEYFLDTIDGFLVRKMIIVEDQAVLQSVCLRFPEICAYVPFDQVRPMDNHYFGLRYVVHYGGNFKLWRYNPPLAVERF